MEKIKNLTLIYLKSYESFKYLKPKTESEIEDELGVFYYRISNILVERGDFEDLFDARKFINNKKNELKKLLKQTSKKNIEVMIRHLGKKVL